MGKKHGNRKNSSSLNSYMRQLGWNLFSSNYQKLIKGNNKKAKHSSTPNIRKFEVQPLENE